MKLPFKLPHKIEERNRVIGLLIGAGVAVVLSLLYAAGPLRAMNDVDLDRQFDMRKSWFDKFPEQGRKLLPLTKDVVFIEIDDKTLEWEKTFPDDPLYYTDAIDALGKDNVGARAVLFSKDYANSFGRKVDIDMRSLITDRMLAIAQILGASAYKKQEIADNLTNLGGILQSPDGAASAPAIAQRLDQMIYDEEFAAADANMAQVGPVADSMKTLDALAPNRETLLANSMNKARNVYFINQADNMLDVQYSAKELRHKKSVRKLFEKVLSYPTLNRPENPKEGLVYDTYHNLLPKEMDVLLEKGENPFTGAAEEKIREDRQERAAVLAEYMKQNGSIGKKASPGLEKTYISLRRLLPVEKTIGEVTAGQGVFKAEVSSDGKLRRFAPAFIYNGMVFPHIDLLLTAASMGAGPKDIYYEKRDIIIRPKGKKELVIPVDKDGTVIIDWAGVWADTTLFKHTSLKNLYLNILRNKYYQMAQEFKQLPLDEQAARLDAMTPEESQEMEVANSIAAEITPPQGEAMKKEVESYKNKIAIVGTTAIGTEDLNPTPLEPRYPILGLHANIINMFQHGNFIRVAPAPVVILIICILSISLGFIGGVIRLKSSVTTAVLNFFIMLFVTILYFVAANALFIGGRISVPVIVPIMAVILTFLLVFLYRFITEEAEKKKMQGMFSTYVNKEVVEDLIENPDKLKLGGDWMNCSVFFSDVAGFTSISESMPPEDLVELLNEYLTAMTDIIFSYGGTLDKYIGDAIVAVYGAPIPYPDHAKRACLATIDMQKKLAEMRVVWKEQGKTELTARAGVNTGRMIAGNMGSKKRFCYTVMGSNVEFGEHLESGGKTWGTIMSISEQTKIEADEFIHSRLLDLDWHDDHPVEIYEIMGKKEEPLPDNVLKGIITYEEGVTLYYKRKWDEAIAKFNEVYTHIPGDGPTKKALERCEKCKAKEPGEEFDQRAAHLFSHAPSVH